MEHLENFLKITLYPVVAVWGCGFMAWVCKHLFMKLLGRGGHKAEIFSSVIGTPIHELGHAVMCLLFGHKIVKLVLWQPHSADGSLGYVRHSYDPENLYHRLGNLFISTGPIFSGMAVLSLLLALFFPDTWNTYISSAGSLVKHHASVPEIVSAGLRMIPDLICEFRGGSSVWVRLLSLLAMLSVSLHINLSPDDIKGALDGLPLYLMITLMTTAIATLVGPGAIGLVLSALRTFHVFMTAMFSVVLTFTAAQAALALVIRLFLSVIGR